jgi:hypothetical protein
MKTKTQPSHILMSSKMSPAPVGGKGVQAWRFSAWLPGK